MAIPLIDRRSALVGILGVAGAGGAIGLTQAQAPRGSRAISPAQPIRVDGGPDGKKVSLAQVPIGAGGFVTGIDISTDGTRFACRTDVANAYIRDAGDKFWRPLFSPSSLAPEDRDPLPDRKDKADTIGVAGIRMAPSNKDVIYAAYLGYVWKSVDGGRSIRRTKLPQKRFNANSGAQRVFNPTIDVHPRDPATAIVGTWGDGVWFTSDGGVTWGAAAVPEATKSLDDQPGLNFVLFDPTNPSTVYVFVTGQGLFRSANGPGGTYELLAGGPAHSSNIVAAPDGAVVVCEHSKEFRTGKVWRYSPGSGWTKGESERELLVVALDPLTPGRAIGIEPFGQIYRSDDNCASFKSIRDGKWARQGGEIGWMRSLNSLFPSQIRFDRHQRDRLWIAHGVGVASAEIGIGGVALEDWSAGIEELCATSALCVPGGKTFVTCWDRPIWRIDNLTSYTNDFRFPVLAGKRHTTDMIAFASALDYAPEDKNFLVAVVAPSEHSAPGFTSDGGDSWQAFAGSPTGGWAVGGAIAAASRTNFVLLQSNKSVGVFTLDGGKSWDTVKLGGTTPDRFSNAYYVPRHNITADKSRPGTFALVYTVLSNEGIDGNPIGGLWVTNDGGRTWTQHLKGHLGPKGMSGRDHSNQGGDERQYWSCQLDYVPGRSGELVYTPHADAAADRFYWSQDDGRNWAELHRSVRNVDSFAFGKPAPGQARPALCFWGEVRGRRGLYASFDWFASEPRLLSRFPSDMLAPVSCLGGDPDRLGRFYAGTSCAGWIRIDAEV